MNNLSKLAIVSAFCLYAGSSLAAGYQLNEYSMTGLGRSFAGAGIVGDDFSALAYNPAGMILNKTSGIQGGLTVAQIHSKIRGDETQRTKMNFGVPLPHAFGQYKINDRFTAGLGIYAPYGLKTKYKRNSFVAAEGVNSELEIIDIAPALAYKATDKLSIGASVIARYIHGNMSNTMPTNSPYGTGFSEFDLDGWTAAWTVGAMYEFTPQTRIGVTYKAKSMQTVKGKHRLSGFNVLPAPNQNMNQKVDNGEASPDLPQSILISGYHQLNEKWGLSSSVRWTDWKDSFPEFTLESSLGDKTVNESWRETWTISFGADYYLNENWTLRAGTAWDQSPVRNKYHRTARIPDSNRVWLSAGASYTNGNIQIDAGYAHLFMKNSQVQDGISAHYKSYSNMFGLQLQYKF